MRGAGNGGTSPKRQEGCGTFRCRPNKASRIDRHAATARLGVEEFGAVISKYGECQRGEGVAPRLGRGSRSNFKVSQGSGDYPGVRYGQPCLRSGRPDAGGATESAKEEIISSMYVFNVNRSGLGRARLPRLFQK